MSFGFLVILPLKPQVGFHVAVSEIVAYHEAGHALVAYLLGGRVRHVTIEPDHDDGPRRDGDTQVVWRRPSLSDKEFSRKSVHVHLAGPVAEMIYSGEPYHPAFVAAWSADWDGAYAAAALLHANPQRRLKYLNHVSELLHQQLQADELWMAVAALADSLLAHETLEQEQVEEVLQELLG